MGGNMGTSATIRHAGPHAHFGHERWARLTAVAALAAALAACSTEDPLGPGQDDNGKTPVPSADTPVVCMNPTKNGNFALTCKAVAVLVDTKTGTFIDDGQVVGVAQTAVAVEAAFAVRNLAGPVTPAVLRVRKIEIGDKTGAFQCLDTANGPCELTQLIIVPGDAAHDGVTRVREAPFRIRYQPGKGAPTETTVRVELHGDSQRTEIGFTVRAIAGIGHLIAKPSEVDFGLVLAGAKATKTISIINVGDAPVTLTALQLTGQGAFTAVLGDTVVPIGPKTELAVPRLLQPGATAVVEARLQPTQMQAAKAQLRVFSNDQSQSGGLVVHLLANTEVPCIQLVPGKVSVGAVNVGESVTTAMNLKNCGSIPVDIAKIGLAGGSSANFTLAKVQLAVPGTLAVGAVAAIEVKYAPDHVNKVDAATNKAIPDLATLVVEAGPGQFAAGAGKAQVLLDGFGVKYKCPTAVIEVKEGEEVIPQTVLHLSGLKSTAKGGAPVAAYKWKVKQPMGSVQSFKPNDTKPTVTFKADVAGEYCFTLDVFDAAGAKSTDCQVTSVCVLVVPQDCLHIELLWTTPADPDQTDSGPQAGADLDLHFASELAQSPDLDCDNTPDPWFSNPYDTYWFNPNPNWGSFDPAADDDPSLDLDDTDGAGPENLNLGCKAESGQYPLGVHYWNDHGYGVSFATIRIYVSGTLAVQITDVKLKPLDMWYVGKVNMPNGLITPGGKPPLSACKQSGDACLYKKAPTSKMAGKMWQPTGSHCITPCYDPPQMGGSPATCTPLGP